MFETRGAPPVTDTPRWRQAIDLVATAFHDGGATNLAATAYDLGYAQTANYVQGLRESRLARQTPVDSVAYYGYTAVNNLGDDACLTGARELSPSRTVLDWRRISDYAPAALRGTPRARAVQLGGGTLIGSMGFADGFRRAARELGAPTFALGTGVESVLAQQWGMTSDEAVAQWREILHDMTYLAVRGPQSAATLREVYGIEAPVCGDIALGISTPAPAPREKHLGMCLAAPADGVWGSSVEEMFEANLDVARSLLRDGWTLQFFIFWPMHDRAITRKLVRALGDSDRVRVTVPATPADFFRVARTCSVFVGTRLHSAVFASMLDIPTVALAYRPKADDFMASIGRTDWSLRADGITGERLRDAVEQLSEEREQHVAQIHESVRSLQAALRTHVAAADAALQSSHRAP